MAESKASAPAESAPAPAPAPAPPKSLEEDLAAVLAKYPAAPSPKEVLELKPNDLKDAQQGPHPQVSQTGYVTWTKPDGTSFLAPISNSEVYERKGYTEGSYQDIPDLVAYHAENASKEAS